MAGIVHERRKHQSGAVAEHQLIVHNEGLEMLSLSRSRRYTHAHNSYFISAGTFIYGNNAKSSNEGLPCVDRDADIMVLITELLPTAIHDMLISHIVYKSNYKKFTTVWEAEQAGAISIRMSALRLYSKYLRQLHQE